MTFDVVTFGESLLRLSPAGDSPVEQATSFDIQVAGSESNTAVGLARLGAKVCWFSRLPDSSLGKLLVNRIREHGVNVDYVIKVDDDRLGLYFVEEGISPRPTQVIYDRAYSAMSAIQESDLPEDLFQPGKARVLHVTGITLALSTSATQTVMKSIEIAKKAGWQISFDANYRSKLWTAEKANVSYEDCMEQADIIFFPLRDVRFLFGFSDAMPTTDILSHLHQLYRHATIVMSQGVSGSVACSPDGEIVSANAFEVAGKYRIGAGDAFSAGFLYSYTCRKDNLQTALTWGNAVAALKFSIPGDMPFIVKEHVEALVYNKISKELVR